MNRLRATLWIPDARCPKRLLEPKWPSHTMGADLSKDAGEPGIVTVTTLGGQPGRETSLAVDQLLEQLEKLKEAVPPPLTPQQQTIADSALVAAIQRVSANSGAPLTAVLQDYQSWSGSRRQQLVQDQNHLHKRIDDIHGKAVTTAQHIKRATLTLEAAQATLKPLPNLVASVTKIIEQTQTLQTQLRTAQHQALAVHVPRHTQQQQQQHANAQSHTNTSERGTADPA